MDALDRFLNRVAYKFDKGYPDVNNPKDMEMLFEMVNNILSEVTDAEEGIKILKREFDFKDEDFKKVSSTRYKVLVPRAERFDFAQKMDDIEGFTFDPNAKGSSMGAVLYKNASFLLKPSGAQGRASAGTENEDILSNNLKKYLEDGPKNVVFVGSNKNYATRAIKDIKDVGYDVAGGKKADIILIGDIDYPISIKKDNAGFWESSDTRYKKVVTALADKIKKGEFAPELTFIPFRDQAGRTKEGIFTMFNKQTQQKVAGVIVTDLPGDDTDSIIFGSDNAVVIYRTFSPKDFSLEGDTLRIKVSKIIEDTQDVEKFNLQPVLRIRHDSTRSATGGLRALVQPENTLYKDGKLKGNNIELSYNEII